MMKVRPDNRWVRAVPADSDLLPLRSVLDGQIRRVERQPQQQAVVEAPVGIAPSTGAPARNRTDVQPLSKFEHLSAAWAAKCFKGAAYF
jgi:hypothetical protein